MLAGAVVNKDRSLLLCFQTEEKEDVRSVSVAAVIIYAGLVLLPGEQRSQLGKQAAVWHDGDGSDNAAAAMCNPLLWESFNGLSRLDLN